MVEPDDDSDEEDEAGASYVPIDPCQGVIAAIQYSHGGTQAADILLTWKHRNSKAYSQKLARRIRF